MKIRFKEKIIKSIQILKNEGLINFIIYFARFSKRIVNTILFGSGSSPETSFEKIFNDRFPHTQQMREIIVDRDDLRLNIITDSLGNRSLFGGVATSLTLAVLFANKNKMPLRIITRETKNNPIDFYNFLKIQGLEKPSKVEFFSDFDRNIKGNNLNLETSSKDIYLTTSWWSTSVVSKLSQKNEVFYLLQEIETYFYPYGDEYLYCKETLLCDDVHYIINSSYLYEFYKNSEFKNIAQNSVFFEPAFSKALYSPSLESFKRKEKYNLFFYARPGNPRNLFYHGLKIINEAIKNEILDPKVWDIYFAGSKLPKIVLANGVKPTILGQMNWEEYSKLIKTVDLGICLMYTPHPSYPPLDIVSSGGAVLTNSFLNKKKLYYSDNIICSDLGEKEMLLNLEKAVGLAKNLKKREKNYKNNQIKNDWSEALEKIIEFMEKTVLKGENNGS